MHAEPTVSLVLFYRAPDSALPLPLQSVELAGYLPPLLPDRFARALLPLLLSERLIAALTRRRGKTGLR